MLELWGCMVCLAPQLFLLVYLRMNVELPSSQAAALLQVLSSPLLISAPPTSLDECFFFNYLVAGLPHSSTFCQFWLFFVFKLLLSFFWLCEEAQCVYLRLHLGWKSQSFRFRGHFKRHWLSATPTLTPFKAWYFLMGALPCGCLGIWWPTQIIGCLSVSYSWPLHFHF